MKLSEYLLPSLVIGYFLIGSTAPYEASEHLLPGLIESYFLMWPYEACEYLLPTS